MKKPKNSPTFWRERIKPLAPTVRSFKKEIRTVFDPVNKLMLQSEISDRMHRYTEGEPSKEYVVKMGVAHHLFYSYQTVEGLCMTAQRAWLRGDLVAYALAGRLIFEYAASLHYALKIIQKGANALQPWDEVNKALLPILFGSRQEFWFKNLGGTPDSLSFPQPESINIITQIKHWQKENTSAEEEYGFLCESCHPNSIEHYFLCRAGSVGDQFFGLITQVKLEQSLQNLVSIVAKATKSVTADLKEMTSLCEVPKFH